MSRGFGGAIVLRIARGLHAVLLVLLPLALLGASAAAGGRADATATVHFTVNVRQQSPNLTRSFNGSGSFTIDPTKTVKHFVGGSPKASLSEHATVQIRSGPAKGRYLYSYYFEIQTIEYFKEALARHVLIYGRLDQSDDPGCTAGSSYHIDLWDRSPSHHDRATVSVACQPQTGHTADPEDVRGTWEDGVQKASVFVNVAAPSEVPDLTGTWTNPADSAHAPWVLAVKGDTLTAAWSGTGTHSGLHGSAEATLDYKNNSFYYFGDLAITEGSLHVSGTISFKVISKDELQVVYQQSNGPNGTFTLKR